MSSDWPLRDVLPELEYLPGAARLLAIWKWAAGCSMLVRPGDLRRLIDGPGCEGPDSRAWTLFTNCMTSEEGVLRCALGRRDMCAMVPFPGGRTLADPIPIGAAFSDMVHAGGALGILTTWKGDRSDAKPGRAVWRRRSGNDDHTETVRRVVSFEGQMIVETVGGGRPNNAITEGTDADFLGGRPWFGTWDWPALVDRLSPARPVMSPEEQAHVDAWRAEEERLAGVVARRPADPLSERETLPSPEE